MKKLLIISLGLLLTFAVQAQVRPTLVTTTSYGNTLDTVVNTASKVTTAFRVANWHTGITAQVIVTKISGTVGGAIGLYGSMDGTNWVLIGSAATPSDASANYSFNTTAAWYYFRINYTGTGTMSASVKTYLMPY